MTAAVHLLSVLLATTGIVPGPQTGVWPLSPQPAVVGAFDPPVSRYGAGHRGVDLAGSPGQKVRAAAAGRVTYAGSLAGRGVVVVSHGTTRTTYEPVGATVDVGTTVAAGTVVGRLEALRSHCAPATCLHWGLIQGETYLDPLTLVGAGPVRLLPWLAPPAALPAPRLVAAPGPALSVTPSGSDGGRVTFGGGSPRLVAR